MPRRPRPNTRPPPQQGAGPSNNVKPAAPIATSRRAPSGARSRPVYPDSESEEESQSDRREDEDEDLSGEDDDDDEIEEEEEDVDVDAPRVAQYVDEEELDEEVEDSESESDEEGSVAGPSNLKSLRDDLSSLPLGALRKAQQALSKSKALGDSEDDQDEASSDADAESEPEELGTNGKPKESTAKEKKEIAKRPHKHAPMEMSSKRPVPRKKVDFDEKKPVPRDPRFLHITGEFSAERFRSQYGFLSDMHEQEMKTLKDNLKRARKMLASSPRDLRAEREREVQRLERAVKRAESLVNRDRREKVEASALARVRQEEKEKRKQGKGAWYMKDADKKELLVKAKFDALAESGGRSAVRKAIEKKQKKVSQKEKKRRPFVPGEKRQGGHPQEARPNKRQKFS